MAREDPHLDRHIERVFPKLTERLSLEEPVRALMESSAFAAVLRLIDAEADAVSRPMDVARPLEHTEYVSRHGRLSGLTAFADAAQTLLSHVERERVEQQNRHEAEGSESLAEEVGQHG